MSLSESNDQLTGDHSTIPGHVKFLGWFGVVPFALLSAAALLGSPITTPEAERALVLYGAVILSFMGGVQWGLAMLATMQAKSGRKHPDAAHLAISICPALVGWIAALLGPASGLALLATGFVALLVFDLWTVRRELAPRWYAPLRIQLTVAVVILLALGMRAPAPDMIVEKPQISAPGKTD